MQLRWPKYGWNNTFSEIHMWKFTLSVMRQARKFLWSPMTITWLRKGISFLILFSMGTGGIFTPSDMMISSGGERKDKAIVISYCSLTKEHPLTKEQPFSTFHPIWDNVHSKERPPWSELAVCILHRKLLYLHTPWSRQHGAIQSVVSHQDSTSNLLVILLYVVFPII